MYEKIIMGLKKKNYRVFKTFNIKDIELIGGIHVDEKVDHCDTIDHISTCCLILVWDFR